MRKFLILIFILLCPSVFADTFTVEEVIDGQTLKLTNGQEVRLIGIEILDDAKMGGQEALEYLKGLRPETFRLTQLEFDVKERDELGRLLAYVYLCPVHMMAVGTPGFAMLYKGQACHMLNAQMIWAGYASLKKETENVKYADLFQKLFKEAIAQKRGLFDPELRKKMIPKEMKDYYDNGNIRMLIQWTDIDTMEGTFKGYYETGELEGEGFLKDSEEGSCGWEVLPVEGLMKTYYKNGQLKSEDNFKNNCYEGISMTYYPDGNIREEKLYKENKMVYRKAYKQSREIESEYDIRGKEKQGGEPTQ